MGVLPSRCLVIEDSMTGVNAGVAAGMTVIGLTAASHHPDVLSEDMKKAGASYIFSSWLEIISLIQGFQPNSGLIVA